MAGATLGLGLPGLWWTWRAWQGFRIAYVISVLYSDVEQLIVKLNGKMAPSLCAQDHVILLLSSQDFENPPPWLSDNFNIQEGGTHAGGSSRNKLIVFEDGTYLELFTWIDKPQEFLAWADKTPGLIDFALTSMPTSTAESIQKDNAARLAQPGPHLSIHVEYSTPKAGSRTRTDGVKVQWESSRPMWKSKSSASTDRTDIPFFCHDITSRNIRVPFDDREKTTHPCGAVGIAAVMVRVWKYKSFEYWSLYESILDIKTQFDLVPEPATESYFPIATPAHGSDSSSIRIVLGEEDCDPGICGLRLAVNGLEGHGVRELGMEGTANTIALEW